LGNGRKSLPLNIAKEGDLASSKEVITTPSSVEM